MPPAPGVAAPVSPIVLAAVAKSAASRLGFAACGICDLRPSESRAAFDAWLAAGYHGAMHYMARQAARRREPSLAWTEATSAVVVLHNYYSESRLIQGRYRVARYAQGADYHQVTREKLDRLGTELMEVAGRGRTRSYVDAGPLPERELARRAGLGWFGKNTLLIHPRLGSFTFIGVLLTDLDLARDEPFEADRCGTCTRCLQACPTGAFVSPRVLDATRCVSYLTIESREAIPEALRAGVGDNLFGCDICQDVCPWNVKFARETEEAAFRPAPEEAWPSLDEILAMDEDAFATRFGPTPLERARLRGLKRNAEVVLENLGARIDGDVTPTAPSA
jgi:epoxyqueuosine reductase